MTTIRVPEGLPIEVAIKRFKKAVELDGTLKHLRKYEAYTKPSVAKKMKSIAARKAKAKYSKLRNRDANNN